MIDKKLLVAAALAGLTLGVNAAEKTEKAKATEKKEVEGQCFDVNTCKGTSACHSEANSCAGTNSCKGKGWLKMSEKDCTAKKGKFKTM
jgi:hypothetical protein